MTAVKSPVLVVGMCAMLSLHQLCLLFFIPSLPENMEDFKLQLSSALSNMVQSLHIAVDSEYCAWLSELSRMKPKMQF